MAVWYRSYLIPFGLALIAFLIITTGGWIRISDAGESCPDWPQCFGTWGFDISEEEQAQWWEENPDEIDSRGAQHRYTTDQIFTEWAHRGLVAIIGVLVIYSHYTAWSLKDKIGTRTYRTHYIASVFLVLQAILGYITVDLDNAPWTVSLHLFMALVFTTSLLAVGFFWWQGQEGLPENLKVKNLNSKSQNLISIVMVLILIQLLIGAYLSTSYHRGACGVGTAGWPLCSSKLIPSFSEFGVLLQLGHRFSALAIGGILVWVRMQMEDEVIIKTFNLALGFFGLNIALGGIYILSATDVDFPGWISLLHLLVGALTFLSIATAYLLCIVKGESDD